jgi:adenylylsulfate kinase
MHSAAPCKITTPRWNSTATADLPRTGEARGERLWFGQVLTPKNIKWQSGLVTRDEREALRGHRRVVLWFTGLSGSGKSTLSHALERALIDRGCSAYCLDGDNVRHGLSSDLDFSPEGRRENIRRIGELARLFVDAGVIAICAFVSPYRADRASLRATVGASDFVEIYVKASVDVCRQRDPKGLYAKAEHGEIADLTGIGSPYEPPEQPDLILDTEQAEPAQSTQYVLDHLEQRGLISRVPKHKTA